MPGTGLGSEDRKQKLESLSSQEAGVLIKKDKSDRRLTDTQEDNQFDLTGQKMQKGLMSKCINGPGSSPGHQHSEGMLFLHGPKCTF